VSIGVVRRDAARDAASTCRHGGLPLDDMALRYATPVLDDQVRPPVKLVDFLVAVDRQIFPTWRRRAVHRVLSLLASSIGRLGRGSAGKPSAPAVSDPKGQRHLESCVTRGLGWASLPACGTTGVEVGYE
jgi:hypothetical protein